MARRFSAEDLPRPSIGNNVEGDRSSFVKAMHPGAFDRADVRPLHGSLRHITLPSGNCAKKAALARGGSFEIWRKSSVRRGRRGEAKSFGRSSIVQCGASRFGCKDQEQAKLAICLGALALQPAIKDLFVKD
jgi:hypothetical protein